MRIHIRCPLELLRRHRARIGPPSPPPPPALLPCPARISLRFCLALGFLFRLALLFQFPLPLLVLEISFSHDHLARCREGSCGCHYDQLSIKFELTTWVMCRMQVLQALARNMGVDLGGGNIRMPSSSCTTRKSAPWFSRWVAKAWRSVCGDSGAVMPARAHAS
jgi:hypothetical protein